MVHIPYFSQFNNICNDFSANHSSVAFYSTFFYSSDLPKLLVIFTKMEMNAFK